MADGGALGFLWPVYSFGYSLGSSVFGDRVLSDMLTGCCGGGGGRLCFMLIYLLTAAGMHGWSITGDNWMAVIVM